MSLEAVVAIFLQYKYPALVVLSIIEGPYIMMMSGFLLKLGTLALIPTFIALSIGDLIADIVWYYVGHFFGDRSILRLGGFFDITAENIENAKRLFSRHRRKILVGSKMTAGFGLSLATLVTAGIMRVPFWEYIALNFFGQLVWTTVMLSVGYVFGNLYVVVNDVFSQAFIICAALVTIYLLLRLSRHIGRSMKNISTRGE
ncbi:MAG: DedA family protein [Candidatus Paceibacterota bacterium]|jgi:membrane protein DedA with SNARE-associated domain